MTLTMYQATDELHHALQSVSTQDNNTLKIHNPELLRKTVIDELIFTAVFSPAESLQKEAREMIFKLAGAHGAHSSSIHRVYQAFGRKELSGFTVPAMNIRTLTYDTARVVFRLAIQHNIATFIFEIARSEMGYSHQRPQEYTTAVLAAAIKENYTGPVFLQGDHFQFNKKAFDQDPDNETMAIKSLVKESLDAKFYNIDIDASTLVELEKHDLSEQQFHNFTRTAELTEYIRSQQPQGSMVSIGGEIGHIGGTNSTVSDFDAFMTGYTARIKENGISKVSVQTGTSHGGTPLADGTIAKVNLDFSVLHDIGSVAREKYGIGGAVQHGASTLPDDLFGEFVNVGTLEIHLATGFQNIVFAHLPAAMRKEMEEWTTQNMQKERGKDMNDAQFIYKLRKKSFGPFKEKLWNMTDSDKEPVMKALEEKFRFLFQKLHVVDTKDKVAPFLS